jgi:hypothetical protein
MKKDTKMEKIAGNYGHYTVTKGSYKGQVVVYDDDVSQEELEDVVDEIQFFVEYPDEMDDESYALCLTGDVQTDVGLMEAYQNSTVTVIPYKYLK